MDINALKRMSYDEVRQLYMPFLKQQGVSSNTVNTAYSDSFYVWRKGDHDLFWKAVDGSDEEAKNILLETLKKHSSADPQKVINGYLSHIRRFRQFLAWEGNDETNNILNSFENSNDVDKQPESKDIKVSDKSSGIADNCLDDKDASGTDKGLVEHSHDDKDKSATTTDLAVKSEKSRTFPSSIFGFFKKVFSGKNDSKSKSQASNPNVEKSGDMTATESIQITQNLKVGDCLKFGSYYQENSTKKTPIEWIVLQKSDTKMLLISKYALDCKKFHDVFEPITWENCNLRKWLNGDFLKNAFTSIEQKKIAVTKLVNANNDKYGSSGGNSTEDLVFCLSLAEVKSLFKDNESRKCVPTPYVVEKGEYSSVECWWWLRSPGYNQYGALGVDNEGAFDLDGYGVDDDGLAVRPVLWVNL